MNTTNSTRIARHGRWWATILVICLWLWPCGSVGAALAVDVERPGDYPIGPVNRHIKDTLDNMPKLDPATRRMTPEQPPSSRLRQAVDDLEREWQRLYRAKDLHDHTAPSREALFKRCDEIKNQLSGPILTKLELERQLLLLEQRHRFVDSARKQVTLRNWIAWTGAMADLVKEIANAIKSVVAPTPKDVADAFRGIIKKCAQNAMRPRASNPAAAVRGSLNPVKLGAEGYKYFLEHADEMADVVEDYVKQRQFTDQELRNPDFLANELKLFVRGYLRKKAEQELDGPAGLNDQIADVKQRLQGYTAIQIQPGQYLFKDYETLCARIRDLPEWTSRKVVALRIDPPAPTIPVGQTVTFKAIGKYSGGTEFDFSKRVNWPDGETFTATAPGRFTISAEYRSLTAKANITVTTRSSVKALKISPSRTKIGQGQTATFRATAEFWDGSVGDVTRVAVWENGPDFKATQTGTFTVKVKYLGQTATATVTVTQLPPRPPGLSVDRLVVEPGDAVIEIGETVNFSARATYSDGSEEDVTLAATWTPAASFTAERAQSVTIVAAYGGLSTQVVVIVRPDPGPRAPVVGPSGTGPAGKYNILFRPDGTGRPNCFQFYLAAVGGRSLSAPGVLTPRATREGWSVDSAYGAGSQAGWSWAHQPAASSRMAELSVYGGDAYGCRNNGVGTQPPPTTGVGQVSPLPPGIEPYGVWRRKSAFDADRPNCYEFATAALSSPDNYDSPPRQREGWVREPNFFGPFSPLGASAVLSQLSRFGGDYYYCIRQRPPMAVLVNPPSQSIGLGEEANLKALALYADGTTRDISTEATWSQSNPFYGASSGVYTITASYQGLTGSATVTVKESAVIGLTISSAQNVYKVGESAYFTATLVYSDGSSRTVSGDPELTWDPNDYITGDKEGVYHVSATYRGIRSIHSVRFEKDQSGASGAVFSITGLSVAGTGGGSAISSGSPVSASATIAVGEFSGTIAVSWQRLSDGAGSGDIQVLAVSPNSQVPVSRTFAKLAAGMGGVTYDTIRLTVSDGADLSVQATVDFEWRQGDRFLGFVIEDADNGKPGSQFEIGDKASITSKWKVSEDKDTGKTRQLSYAVNGAVFHQEPVVSVRPGAIIRHSALLDTATLSKGTLQLRADLHDPDAQATASGEGKLFLKEGKDRITRAQASLSQGGGSGKTFNSGDTVYIGAGIEAAKEPDGPRTLSLSYRGKTVLSETFDMQGGETASKAFAINTGKLDTGRHAFAVQLDNANGRQDRQIVRIKVQEDPNASGSGSGGLQNVNCTGDTINIKVWDHGTQDGDIITLQLGGTTVLGGFDLNSCGGSEPASAPCAIMNLPFPAGTQVPVTITAHNEGSVSPNTASLKIEGGCTPETQHWGLKTGQSASIFIRRATGATTTSSSAAAAGTGTGSGQAATPTTQSWP